MFTIIDPGRSQCKRPTSTIIGCRTQDFRSPHRPRNHFQKVFPNFRQCHPHCHRRWQVSTVGSVDPLLKAGVNPNLPCSKDSLADPAWGGWKDHLHKCLNLAERLRVWNVMRQFFSIRCVSRMAGHLQLWGTEEMFKWKESFCQFLYETTLAFCLHFFVMLKGNYGVIIFA